MKPNLAFIIFLGLIHLAHSQEIASVNSGANSNNNLIYSVGEVFVVMENPDDSSSGTIGVISRIEFTSLGIDEIQFSGDLKFYPNPASQSIFLESENQEINKIFIFDLNGRIIGTRQVINKQVNLQELQPGIYIIKTDNPNIQSFKIIKK